MIYLDILYLIFDIINQKSEPICVNIILFYYICI